MEDNSYTKKIYVILLMFSLVLLGTLCKLLSSVVLPVIIAFLLALAMYPAVKKLNTKFHFPWILAVFSVIILMIAFVGILSSLLVKGLSTIFAEYPKYENRFISIYEIIAENLNLGFDADKSLFKNMWDSLQIRAGVQKLALYLSSGALSGGKTIFLIFLLLIFLMIEMNSLKKRIVDFIGPDSKFNLMEVTREIISEVSHYLSIKFFISLITGVLVFLGSLAVGLSFPIVWGFTAFIMNFIPTFGSIFSSAITTAFAIVQFYPSFGKVLFVLIYMIAVNMVLGNIIEPRIEGKHLGLSPFAILINLSLFGYIWGFIGMIIAVPLAVSIKIICENIPELNFFSILLGQTKQKKSNKEKNKPEKPKQTKQTNS